ncbi:single-stranded DNA-binding protein 1 [Paenibacillus macerans]|uniref:single-stranded DNA-binding protein n=1 Tax=Paenibacillus macerans TaxID=44252 RepID=UPI001AFFC44E|nr:single-stranded DNA-binding protein [Paenibacillus macerans]GIP08176.1 single-stranded DNA-binding protein 1 [Paenibacillus macerans]
MSLNQVALIGRLTKDPELRYTPSGVAVTQFTLAVDRPFTNQNGEREADFIPVVVWKSVAENVANYQRKGNLVAVTGRIQVRNYENNEGRRVYVTEVIGQSVQFLTPQSNGSSQNASRQGGGNSQNHQAGTNEGANPAGDNWGFPDEDLPF